jgi:hypothetical protein
MLISLAGDFLSPDAARAQNLVADVHSASSSVMIRATTKRGGKSYQIRYNRARTRIELHFGQKEVTLNRIPKNYDPSMVGSDKVIGFLPDAIQPYKPAGFLVYVSSKRTSGGSGGGQCGSGSEIYLNFLDTKTAIPKVRSKILIGSCDESIELNDQNIVDGILGEIDVAEGRLRLHFLNYKQMEGSPTATVSSDFSALLFGDADLQKQKRRHDHS